MAKKKKEELEEEVLEPTDSVIETKNTEDNTDDKKSVEDELAEIKDKYLRLYSEFENFRRRTAKERLDLIQTSTEDLDRKSVV